MQGVKRAAAHAETVVRIMLFIGFSIQILLGIAWMCGNFPHVQDFGEADSALYRGIFRLFGGVPQILYLLQIGTAFCAECYFLKTFSTQGTRKRKSSKFWTVWSVLALITYPFAMQCHLALLPFSFMGTLFLLILSFVMQAARKKEKATASRAVGKDIFVSGKRRLIFLVLAVACMGLFILLSGEVDAAKREKPGNSFEAAMASRFAWPTIWVDRNGWNEELQEIVKDILWETSYYPGNMELLEAAIEGQTDPETAKAYYMEIAKNGWQCHAPMVIRQIGWDVLGYTVTPVIFQLQLKGRAYDSYTGRNYEIMRGNLPVLTRKYINYSCWWFGVSILLTLLSIILRRLAGVHIPWQRLVIHGMVCLFFTGILVGILTMRGAGLMDYKYTIAVNQLWLAAAIVPVCYTF